MEAYAHFRLDRQAIPCSKATMLTYEYLELLINENGRPYRNWGVDAMMDRLQEAVGFRIHRTASGIRSRQWRPSWAETSRACAQRWATRTT
jgi:hypothetical protein